MKIELLVTNKNVFIIVDEQLVKYDKGIRLIRNKKNWCRMELAYKLGVSHRTIEGWETGRYKPKRTTLILLKHLI